MNSFERKSLQNQVRYDIKRKECPFGGRTAKKAGLGRKQDGIRPDAVFLSYLASAAGHRCGLVLEQQQVGESTLVAIEEQMLEAGYSAQRVEEAQAVYLLALFDKSDEEQFVERLVGCFEEEQTDAELISAVNAEFGTAITPSEFTEALKEVREKYLNQEENSSG